MEKEEETQKLKWLVTIEFIFVERGDEVHAFKRTVAAATKMKAVQIVLNMLAEFVAGRGIEVLSQQAEPWPKQ